MAQTHASIAQRFAAGTIPASGAKGFNIFADSNAAIFSYGYHFHIAIRIKDQHGDEQVILTSRGYSVSTAKHITIVRHALIRAGIDYIEAPLGRNPWEDIEKKPAYIRTILRSQLVSAVQDWHRARTRKPIHWTHCMNLAANIDRFTRAFVPDKCIPSTVDQLRHLEKHPELGLAALIGPADSDSKEAA